jgi:hypothetical protein
LDGVFAMTALSATTAWQQAPGRLERQHVFASYALNGFLNVLWSLSVLPPPPRIGIDQRRGIVGVDRSAHDLGRAIIEYGERAPASEFGVGHVGIGAQYVRRAAQRAVSALTPRAAGAI